MSYPVPYLIFADTRGLELPRFNTLRLGPSWSKRLVKGDRVLLATKTEVIGSARVHAVDCKYLESALLLYATDNHIELAMSKEPGYDWALAVLRREESMRKNYPPSAMHPRCKVSIITLKR